MRKVILILVLFLASTLLVGAQDLSVMRTKPFLQSPSDTQITVSWFTNYRTLSCVEYGQDKDSLQRVFALKNGQVIANTRMHHVTLENLQPNTKYYYKVVSKVIKYYGAYKKTFGEEEESQLYSFTTAPKVGEDADFTAVIFNDLHQKVETAQALTDMLGDLDYDFVIFNGDCIDDPKDEAQVVNTISVLNQIVGAEQVPVIYLRGNHEIRNAYSVWLYDILKTIAGDCSYGAFSWGDTRMLLLDCGEDKADDHWVYFGMNDFEQFREDQKEFIIEEVKTKVYKRASHRVLIHHIPLFGNFQKYTPCQELWGDILNDAKIDCAIVGHTHKVAYHPRNSIENDYPVFVGGGPKIDESCVTIIRKKGGQMIVEQLDPNGKVLNAEVFDN